MKKRKQRKRKQRKNRVKAGRVCTAADLEQLTSDPKFLEMVRQVGQELKEVGQELKDLDEKKKGG
jgi:hypothetical protein